MFFDKIFSPAAKKTRRLPRPNSKTIEQLKIELQKKLLISFFKNALEHR
jgi:hypothetical protein